MALTLFAVNNGYFDDIEVGKALAAERGMREHCKSKFAATVEAIERDKKLSKDIEAQLHDCLKQFKQSGAY